MDGWKPVLLDPARHKSPTQISRIASENIVLSFKTSFLFFRFHDIHSGNIKIPKQNCMHKPHSLRAKENRKKDGFDSLGEYEDGFKTAFLKRLPVSGGA